MTNPKHTDTSPSGDLKPCPFCGSAFKMGQEPHDNFPVNGMYYIYHDYGPLGSAARRCPVDVMGHFNSADEAIAAWNNRRADRIEALEAEVERLREAVGEIKEAWDWWNVDTYDRCASVVDDAIRAALGEKQ